VVVDVGNQEDVRGIAEAAIAGFGTFDTWGNNAGVSIFGRCEEIAIADMQRIFDTVYWGAVYGSRMAVAHCRHRGAAASPLPEASPVAGAAAAPAEEIDVVESVLLGDNEE
jgi:NAD(P)-dependent dehydrogenase (short-subunit alcohol dehydrogenase family)